MLWEPPRVDCLTIATSGRFAMPAVRRRKVQPILGLNWPAESSRLFGAEVKVAGEYDGNPTGR